MKPDGVGKGNYFKKTYSWTKEPSEGNLFILAC